MNIKVIVVLLIISLVFAVIGLAGAISRVSTDEQPVKAEREEPCPLPGYENTWCLKTGSRWCWEITKAEYLISDTLRKTKEETVLEIMEAREKRGFTLVERTDDEDDKIVKLIWRKP